MEKNLMILRAAPALVPIFVTIATAMASAQSQVNERRPIARDASIRILNLVGSTRVIGWDRDSIAVTGSVAGKFYLAGGAPGAKLGVELPLEEQNPGPSHLEVQVPAKARVWVKSSTADIEVSGVTGSVDLNSVSGRIRVQGNPAEIQVESMDGPVEISVTARWVRAKTASAPITLRGDVSDVAVTSVSGGIAIQGGRFEKGRFESVTGDVRFQGELDRGGSFQFENHSGAIELRLGATASAEFDVTTFAGDIENGLSRVAPHPGPGRQGKELTFAVGDGSAQVSIRNFKGRVALRRP